MRSSRGQSVRRAIAEANQRSQRPIFGWVTKIYYLELLRISEDMDAIAVPSTQLIISIILTTAHLLDVNPPWE
jgi:hypothetical protein